MSLQQFYRANSCENEGQAADSGSGIKFCRNAKKRLHRHKSLHRRLIRIFHVLIVPYPEASEEVIAVLRTTERKMQYQEYDLKTERTIIDHKTQTVQYPNCRESLFLSDQHYTDIRFQ